MIVKIYQVQNIKLTIALNMSDPKILTLENSLFVIRLKIVVKRQYMKIG